MSVRTGAGGSKAKDNGASAPAPALALSPTPRPSYRQALRLLDAAQKSGDGVPAYTRWVNRRLARFAAAAAASRGVSANGVTFISAAFSAAALACLVLFPATPWVGAGIAVLLAAGYVLDSADGQVARVTKTGSLAGEWLDHVVDSVRVPAIHLAVLVGIWQGGALPGWTGWIPMAYALTSAGQFMSQILAEQLLRGRANTGHTPAGRLRSWVVLPSDLGTLCWLFLLWGSPWIFITAYGLLFVAQGVIVVASVKRKYQALQLSAARG